MNAIGFCLSSEPSPMCDRFPSLMHILYITFLHFHVHVMIHALEIYSAAPRRIPLSILPLKCIPSMRIVCGLYLKPMHKRLQPMLECMEESLKEEELKKVKREKEDEEVEQEITRLHDGYGCQTGVLFSHELMVPCGICTGCALQCYSSSAALIYVYQFGSLDDF